MHCLIKAFVRLSFIQHKKFLNLIEMLETLDPFQQLLLGVTSVGVLMIVIVIFLTSSPNFENTDRFKKILDSFEKKN